MAYLFTVDFVRHLDEMRAKILQAYVATGCAGLALDEGDGNAE